MLQVFMHGVKPEELPSIYPKAAYWLSRIPMLEERYGLEAVYEQLAAERWQLWLMCAETVLGALLTQIIQYPRRRELHLLGVAGERMTEWLPLIGTIEDYARKNDCARVSMHAARKGFSELLKGYTGNLVMLEKEL